MRQYFVLKRKIASTVTIAVWTCRYCSPGLASEAQRFLAPFAVNSIVASMQEIHEGSFRGNQVLIYMSGREDEEQLSQPLKRLAKAKRRLRRVVLCARRADHRNVVHWARAAERTLPEHTEFCFSAMEALAH